MSQRDLSQMIFLHQNPVRALIVANAEDYIFSSVSDYSGTKGMVNIVTEIGI
jgi:putative transposase